MLQYTQYVNEHFVPTPADRLRELRELNVSKAQWSYDHRRRAQEKILRNREKGNEFLNISTRLGLEAQKSRSRNKRRRKKPLKKKELSESEERTVKTNKKSNLAKRIDDKVDEYEEQFRQQRRLDLLEKKKVSKGKIDALETKDFLQFVEESDSIICNTPGERVMNLKYRNVAGQKFRGKKELVLDSIHKKLHFMNKMAQKENIRV